MKNTACLLLHGLCGTPFEVAPLEPGLRQLGCHTIAPVLPGHGTTVADLKKTLFSDWVAFAEHTLLSLQQSFERVVVIGFSMGGSIALELATRHVLAGVVTLSAPCRLYRLVPFDSRPCWIPLLGVLRYIRPYPSFRKARPESKAIAPFQGYEGVLCLPQLYSMHNAYKSLRQKLGAVACPALVMHDLHDRIVSPGNALEIAGKLGSRHIRLLYTSSEEQVTSHHHIATHRDTSFFVQEAVTGFVQALSNESF